MRITVTLVLITRVTADDFVSTFHGRTVDEYPLQTTAQCSGRKQVSDEGTSFNMISIRKVKTMPSEMSTEDATDKRRTDIAIIDIDGLQWTREQQGAEKGHWDNSIAATFVTTGKYTTVCLCVLCQSTPRDNSIAATFVTTGKYTTVFVCPLPKVLPGTTASRLLLLRRVNIQQCLCPLPKYSQWIAVPTLAPGPGSVEARPPGGGWGKPSLRGVAPTNLKITG